MFVVCMMVVMGELLIEILLWSWRPVECTEGVQSEGVMPGALNVVLVSFYMFIRLARDGF